ncbi:hypothetical protein XENOCAPTIV_023683 [Xenoophorus captivus]|uniref:BED-type domain-containing protein n=1 Tax=Xenoophorus captivus TaxID=1517983 RepID=A0ABV0RLJ9_9TELE
MKVLSKKYTGRGTKLKACFEKHKLKQCFSIWALGAQLCIWHYWMTFYLGLGKRIIVTLREWRGGRFSMPDMNTALHAQQRNDISGRWYQQQSTTDRKRLKVWLHFSECDADYAPCHICDVKRKASGGNISELRKHLVKNKISLKAEECWSRYTNKPHWIIGILCFGPTQSSA